MNDKQPTEAEPLRQDHHYGSASVGCSTVVTHQDMITQKLSIFINFWKLSWDKNALDCAYYIHMIIIMLALRSHN